jgi:hypothetical protein
MDATTAPKPAVDREVLAGRLLTSSQRLSYDPLVAIDWDAPLEPGKPAGCWHRSSLYGTPLWERMTEEQRLTLSRHEMASLASVGIWFELILISMLTRHAYDRDAQSQHVQYALTEIADECRHSVMFGKLTEKLGAPAYGPGRAGLALGKWFRATASQPEIFAAALFVEELLDALQREAVEDEAVQPLVREAMRIHTVEEARHMRYAADELTRQWDAYPAARKWMSSVRVSVVCWTAAGRLIHPQVYAAAGLDVGSAVAAAAANPHWRETKIWAARKVMDDFTRRGLLDPAPARRMYAKADLIPSSDRSA